MHVLIFITELFKSNNSFFPDWPLLFPSGLWNKGKASEEICLVSRTVSEAGGRNNFNLATGNLKIEQGGNAGLAETMEFIASLVSEEE